MIRHFFTKQFLAFITVGAVAAFLHWLARYGLSFFLPFPAAVALAYGVGITIAFILNSFFIFPISDKPRHLQIRDFILVNLAFLPVVWLTAVFLSQWLKSVGMINHSEDLAHALAIPIPMFATFLIYKFFAFKDTSCE